MISNISILDYYSKPQILTKKLHWPSFLLRAAPIPKCETLPSTIKGFLKFGSAGTVAIYRELTRNSQLVINRKNRENTCQRKTITRTRQYLRGSAIFLHPQNCKDFTIIKEKKIQSAATVF